MRLCKKIGIGGLIASGGIGAVALEKGLYNDFSKKEASKIVDAIYKEGS